MNIEYDKNFYYKVHKFIQAYMKFFYKLDITGLENIPSDSNYILAGNHLHILDSWLLLTYNNDYVRFMVDNKLYRYKLWEWFFKKLGTIGTTPDDTDIKSLKEAINLLKFGENIAIFPEGHTHSREVDLEYKPGVARISRITNTPIIPFGIYGSYKPFHLLKLNIGQAINYKTIDLPNDEIDADLENRIKCLIKRG